MTGGSRIVAIDAASAEGTDAQTIITADAEAAAMDAFADDADEAAYSEPVIRRWPGVVAAAVAMLAAGGWTALFVLANISEMQAGAAPQQWVAWIRDWSVPVALVAVLWLVAMRNSRREALRFGATARLLGDESARLEARLTNVNHELSLAREFITAQARDLESLGRVAGDRLSEHADRLAGLIRDNGKRIDAIGTVSAAALDNMEKLRFQLPVIASSAKDVTNNIGAAGRTAHGQLEEMVQGFNRLSQFGQASEQQVKVLRDLVETTLGEFAHHAEHLEIQLQARFAALSARGEEFRVQLDGHEVEALAAIRGRAQALGDELAATRELLDGHEAESLTSLRARLSAVRDESGAIARSLRDSETSAVAAWRSALAQLAEEVEVIDARMIERDRIFADEIETRRAEFAQRHADFNASITAQMAALDAEIARRQGEQESASRQLANHSETIAGQLATFAAQMEAIAAQGGAAEAAVARSLDTLAQQLIASREALSGTDAIIADLTDSSVRLLELIRAGVQHSEQDLPAAIGTSEARLTQLAENVDALRDVVKAAQDHGEALASHVDHANAGLDHGLAQAGRIDASLNANQVAIGAIGQSLDALGEQAASLAGHAQNELTAAINTLDTSARAAIAGIENMSAASVSAVAARIGQESGVALDRAMRVRAAEVAGQLEQAAAHAAGVSREAALQLREQLGKVNELAGNLERRVAQARERAQEQVDNDFARRVALITESLNSNAVDIARVMDTEVTDKAWASYLRGDRGIFTRRAVRLLETPEAKTVVHLYETDRAFHDHVSRYIHDFEAMLRQLLSTRDGHALGVTLLSSDMGKLYVALAQSIERLRK
jgi:hypothetical protein